MALANIWKIHSIVRVLPAHVADRLNVANTFVGGITNVAMPVQANVQTQVPAGQIYATSGYISFQSTDVTFTTTLAKALIDMVGVSGACFAPGGDELDIYLAKHDCSGPVAGANHRRYTIKKGILHLTSLSCEHQGNLEVSAQMRAVYDGTNDPVEVTDSVALPGDSLLGDLTEQWTLSTSADNSVNAQLVGSKRSVSVDFGVNTSTQGSDSDAFDTFASIDSIQPVLTCNGVDPTWFDHNPANGLGLGSTGAVGTHANTAFSFRKRDGAGGFVSDVTAEHIQMTAYGPVYFDQLLSGSGQEAATTSFRMQCLKDGNGNPPLQFDTATAI